MKKTFWMTGLAALLAGLLMMTTRTMASPAEGPAPAVVKIDNFSFSPNPLTVAVGTEVHWTNHDDVPHNVVADDKSFKSKTMDTDESFTMTFTKPGTYSYFCGLHPRMTGKVVVK
jgi:plastocyanin